MLFGFLMAATLPGLATFYLRVHTGRGTGFLTWGGSGLAIFLAVRAIGTGSDGTEMWIALVYTVVFVLPAVISASVGHVVGYVVADGRAQGPIAEDPWAR